MKVVLRSKHIRAGLLKNQSHVIILREIFSLCCGHSVANKNALCGHNLRLLGVQAGGIWGWGVIGTNAVRYWVAALAASVT